ncbi:MAG TPA: methyltransferase family protein [Candidatus Hypogeohydataceae bacterium YC41]
MTEFPFVHLTLSGILGFGLAIAGYLSSSLRNIIFPFNVALFSIMITLTTMSRLLLPLCPQPRLFISTQLALVLGLPIFLIGVFFILLALFQVGLPSASSPPKKQRRLAKEGIYNQLRHPIYIGEFLWCLGWAVMFKALWALLVTPLWLFLLLAIALTEEKLLEKEHGDEYLVYKQRVPFAIPRILKSFL